MFGCEIKKDNVQVRTSIRGPVHCQRLCLVDLALLLCIQKCLVNSLHFILIVSIPSLFPLLYFNYKATKWRELPFVFSS